MPGLLPGLEGDGPVVEPSPRKVGARRVKHWPPTPEAEQAIRRILTALADAREAAGWEPNRLKPATDLCRKRHGAVALRLFELQRDGEADPEGLIVAVLRAKVEQQRRRDGDHGAGLYAHAKSICSGEWWDSNLAAGRAWLASGGRPAANGTVRGRTFVRHAEEESLV